MRKLIIITVLLTTVLLHSPLAAQPRVALVLSGGVAARGLSEIGVIKALEEENIPIDYVAGTSMGAVLGSLLAQGYSAAEIERIAKSINWMQAFIQTSSYQNLLFGEKKKYGKYLFRLELDGLKPVIPQSLVKGQKPSVLFTQISIKGLNTHNFDKFKIPFRANATDLETGKEVIFSSGYLPKVLQASSAVPMMLPPVAIGDKLLIDGGAVNNLPVNLVKEFSPDLIIAVDLGVELRKKEDLKSLFSIMSQNLLFSARETAKQHRKQADILIEPNVSGYSFSDFDKIDEIISVGYQAAQKQMPQLKKLLAEKRWKKSQLIPAALGPTIEVLSVYGNNIYDKWSLYRLITSSAGSAFDPVQVENDRKAIENQYFFDGYLLARVNPVFNPENGNLKYYIDEGIIKLVEFKGRQNISDVFLKSKLKYQKIFNIDNIKDNVDRLYASGFFESVGFNVVSLAKGHTLQYILAEKHSNSLAIGLHYDTYQHLSLLADLTFKHFRSQNLQQTLSLKIGNEYNLQFISEFWPESFGQNLVGEATIYYFNTSQDLYTGSQLNSTFYYLTKGVRCTGAANLGYFGELTTGLDARNVTYSRIFSLLPNENITKMFVRSRIDALDNPLLPKNGFAARVEYQQAVKMFGSSYDFSKGQVDLAGYHFLPWEHTAFVKSRVYLGKGNVPLSELYRLGGEETLLGYGRNQYLVKHLVQLRLGYRFPLSLPPSPFLEGVYLSLLHDTAIGANKISDLNLENSFNGAGAELQFNTLLGLAGRFSVGFGQNTYLFLALGNEF